MARRIGRSPSRSEFKRIAADLDAIRQEEPEVSDAEAIATRLQDLVAEAMAEAEGRGVRMTRQEALALVRSRLVAK